MANNKKFGHSLTKMKWVILVMQLFIGLLLVMGIIDAWLLGGALFRTLRGGFGSRIFIGVLYPVLFGGSALIIFLSMRSNKEWENTLGETWDNMPLTINDPVEQFCANIVAKSKGFETIKKRYQNYIRAIMYMDSSENVAIDRDSGLRNNMMIRMIFMGLMVVPIILLLVLVQYYLKQKYGLEMYELGLNVREVYPIIYYPVLIIIVCIALWYVVGGFIRLTFSVFGFVNQQTYTVKEYNPEDRRRIFHTKTFRYVSNGWLGYILDYFFKIFLIIVFLPGILIMDWTIVGLGFCMILLCKIIPLLFTGNLSRSLRVDERGVIEITSGFKTQGFVIKDCVEATVKYVDIEYTGNPERLIAGKLLNRAMGYSSIVPGIILFTFSDGRTISIPLRGIYYGLNKNFDSHEAEFFFAKMLNEYGYDIDAGEDAPAAGDWTAIKTINKF